MQIKTLSGTPTQEWRDICLVDDVFEECGRRYELTGLPPLAVFNLAGVFQVTDDTCTHGDASLADGWVTGKLLVIISNNSSGWLRFILPESPIKSTS